MSQSQIINLLTHTAIVPNAMPGSLPFNKVHCIIQCSRVWDSHVAS